MRMYTALCLILVANSTFAANEEQFEWLGVNFCHTTVGEVIELYPDAKYFEDDELLAVRSSGKTLGATYDELFFRVSPRGVIAGVNVPIVSGDIGQIIREIDLLAARRWAEKAHKSNSRPEITWISLSSDTGSDVHMHLNENQTSLLFNIGHSSDDRKWTVIGFTSVTGCDRSLHGD